MKSLLPTPAPTVEVSPNSNILWKSLLIWTIFSRLFTVYQWLIIYNLTENRVHIPSWSLILFFYNNFNSHTIKLIHLSIQVKLKKKIFRPVHLLPLNFRLLSTTQTPNLPHFPVTLLPAIVVCSVTESHLILLWPRGEHQAPRSMGFPRQEYWSGLSFPSPRDFPDPGIKPTSPRWAGSLYHWAPRKAPPSHGPVYFMSLEICLFWTLICVFMEHPPQVISPQCVSIFLQYFYTQPWCGWTSTYSASSYQYRRIWFLLLCCYITVPLNSLVHTSFGLFTTATIDILHSHQQCMKARVSPQPSQQNTL